MRAVGVFVLVCIAIFLPPTNAGGPCEKVENYDWEGSIGTVKTCWMTSTVINTKDFSISSDRDETVKGFYAFINNNLEYLPNNLGEKFPNLLVLLVCLCPIKEIRKENFEGLSKLQLLSLYGNQIEKIDVDTFEHIPAVEEIYLTENKIKKLNGRAFASLHKLTYVGLKNNECIDEYFVTSTMAEISRIVTEKCGFNDSEPFSTKIVEREADLIAQSEELQALKLEMAKLRIERSKFDLQIVLLNEIKAQHNKIKAQLKETCDARIELKVQEISDCSNDLQAKTAEINEKNEKIKKLEKKNQILGGDGPL